MVNKFLISVIFTMLFCNFAKTNSAESPIEGKNINQTTCTWESSQFEEFVRNYSSKNKNYYKGKNRYCVNYKNNTVFSFKNSDPTYGPKRVYGLLNKGEIIDSNLGYYFIYQFEIEDENLVRYSCRTNGPKTNVCINNEQIGKWIYGIKR